MSGPESRVKKSYFQGDSKGTNIMFHQNKLDQSCRRCTCINDAIIRFLIAIEQRFDYNASESDIIVIARLTRYRAAICRTEESTGSQNARVRIRILNGREQQWLHSSYQTRAVSINSRLPGCSAAEHLVESDSDTQSSESCWKSSTVHWARPENFKCADSSTTSCFHSQLFQITVCKRAFAFLR